ncbi:hypothetical protein NL676_035897 [Syzygium grande]|nr:hypothetical protein NL676_035897 [Syzygium grande]
MTHFPIGNSPVSEGISPGDDVWRDFPGGRTGVDVGGFEEVDGDVYLPLDSVGGAGCVHDKRFGGSFSQRA